jgi:hypothetical protein
MMKQHNFWDLRQMPEQASNATTTEIYLSGVSTEEGAISRSLCDGMASWETEGGSYLGT